MPVVVSLAQTEGVAHTLGDGAARLEHDDEVNVQWSETSNADDFSKNLIRGRCEGRFATSVMRPLAVVKADLTAIETGRGPAAPLTSSQGQRPAAPTQPRGKGVEIATSNAQRPPPAVVVLSPRPKMETVNQF